jgi:hypothetical protein
MVLLVHNNVILAWYSEKMGYFAYRGIVIGKGDPCFGGGKGSVICGWLWEFMDICMLGFVRSAWGSPL